MYRKSIWWSADKNHAIIKNYHAAHCEPSSEKNKKRRARKENTTWKQEEINRRHRTEKLQRLLLDNFRAGDWYCTLTYGTGKLPTERQARDDFNKFKRRVRGFYQKENLACQWIGIIEHLAGGGRTHMHFMLPVLAPEKLQQLKKMWPHGNVDIRFYGGTQLDAYRLAEYYTKETTEKHASAVMTSRNLLRTEPRKKTSAADTWKDNYQPPAGYEIVKPLSFMMETDAGYPLQVIVLERINPIYSPRPQLPPPKKKKQRRKKHGPVKKTTPRADKKQASAKD